jgi:ABC-type polysaccharide/polyol phosphate transport system ATPase subunit
MKSICPAILCESVWKTFRLHTHQKLLRQHLASWLGGGGFTQFDALKGLSFQVAQGEGLAAIGSDGAGKSSLLSVVTGWPGRTEEP